MALQTFVARCRLPHPLQQVSAWYERPGADLRLSPPWQTGDAHTHGGDRADQTDRTDGVASPSPQRALTADGAGATRIEEQATYQASAGLLGRMLGGATEAEKLAALFAHRQGTVARDLARHAQFAGPRRRIAVAGASGFVGTALTAYLSTAGHEMVRLVRANSRPSAGAVGTAVAWDPYRGELDLQALGPIDAVVNLAGENVGEGRWTPARKQQLRDSRVIPTRFLAESIARLQAGRPNRIAFISASAIGIYGDRGDELLTESSAPGTDFLAELGTAWEGAAEAAQTAGARVVHPRIGLVLSPQGGPLAKLLPFFRSGLGGRLGSGDQYWSWIAMDDLLHAFEHLLGTESAHGAFNLVAPEPVSNRAVTAALGRALSRPTLFPVPAAALTLLLGDMGGMVLAGARVSCQRLRDSGFEFSFPDLPGALAHLLGNPPLPKLAPTADGVLADFGAF